MNQSEVITLIYNKPIKEIELLSKDAVSNNQIADQYVKQQISNLSIGNQFIVTSNNVDGTVTVTPISEDVNMGNPINIPLKYIFEFFSIVKPINTNGGAKKRSRTNRRIRSNRRSKTNRRSRRSRTNRRY
jgi:hypothetical protein